MLKINMFNINENKISVGQKGIKFIGLAIFVLLIATIYKDGFFNSSTFIILGIFLIWFAILLTLETIDILIGRKK